MESVIGLMEKEIRQATGEDVDAAFDINPQEKLGQTEIKEENKAIRIKTLMIARDLCLAKTITKTYNNIQQFAPYVLRQTKVIEM